MYRAAVEPAAVVEKGDMNRYVAVIRQDKPYMPVG
jgi:hypothetical protein